jgi:cation diffusion facilitator CzcD-associated flavoprotein CzcO
VAPCTTGGWTVTYQNQESGNPELLVADTIVICTGLLSTPRVPAFKVLAQQQQHQQHMQQQ